MVANEKARFKRAFLKPEFLAREATGTRLLDYLKIDRSLPKGQIMRRLDWRFFLEGDVLQKVDIASMANSLEARVPFLDKDFIHMAMHLPDEALFDAMKKKKILKEVLLRHMSVDFVYRPKVGFMLPIEKWISSIAKHLLNNFSDLHIWDLDLLEPKKVQALLLKSSYTFESSYFIFALFTLETWLQTAGLYKMDRSLCHI